MEQDIVERDSPNLSQPVILFIVPVEQLHVANIGLCVHFGNRIIGRRLDAAFKALSRPAQSMFLLKIDKAGQGHQQGGDQKDQPDAGNEVGEDAEQDARNQSHAMHLFPAINNVAKANRAE